MKKFLIGTTALIGSLVFASVASAGETKVSIGGAVEFQAGFTSQDSDAGQSGREFRTLPQLNVKADGKADNGLAYGASLRLNAQTSAGPTDVSVDEAYLYGAGAFGRVELGDTLSAQYKMAVAAPTIGDHVGDATGQVDSDFAAFSGYAPNIGIHAPSSARSTKLSYYTPRFGGAQIGVSYTPTIGSTGKDVTRTYSLMSYRDGIESGVNYQGEIRGVKLGASAGYNYAQAAEGFNREDANIWQLGAQVGYQGFTLGAGYIDNGKSGQVIGSNDETSAWNVGLAYETGPFGVAVSYLSEDLDSVGKYKAVGVGGLYKVAPGLTAGADVVNFKDESKGADEKGTVFLLNTKASF